MASTTVGNVLVGIFTPAFAYPATLSYQDIVNATLEDLGMTEGDCEFLKQDEDKISCVIKNNSMILLRCVFFSRMSQPTYSVNLNEF